LSLCPPDGLVGVEKKTSYFRKGVSGKFVRLDKNQKKSKKELTNAQIGHIL